MKKFNKWIITGALALSLFAGASGVLNPSTASAATAPVNSRVITYVQAGTNAQPNIVPQADLQKPQPQPIQQKPEQQVRVPLPQPQPQGQVPPAQQQIQPPSVQQPILPQK